MCARSSSVRVSSALLVLCLGCSSEPATTPASEDSAVDLDTGTVASDGSTEAAPDAAADVPLADSGCPAPAKITPAEVPTGYMPAERVNLNYTVDGDTAHFYFSAGEFVVRFLYVNTEETSGADKTAFGAVSKAAIDGWLKGATEIKVATRLDKGMPDLDPYMRRLALVFVDGELLQTRILREGHSAYYTQYGCAPAPLHDAFVRAEAEANANDRGIWKAGHPTDYNKVLADWMGTNRCRPNPFTAPYCK